MKSFNNPLLFAQHLMTLIGKEALAVQAGLDKAAELVEKTAKEEFGVYQDAVGDFPAWAELAESTKTDRVRQGFTPNDPLLRTGELRDSISREVKPLEAVVGSDSDIMVYHEFGTVKMPPRPVLAPAAFRNKEKIKAILGSAVVAGLIGGKPIAPALGHDSEI